LKNGATLVDVHRFTAADREAPQAMFATFEKEQCELTAMTAVEDDGYASDIEEPAEPDENDFYVTFSDENRENVDESGYTSDEEDNEPCLCDSIDDSDKAENEVTKALGMTFFAWLTKGYLKYR
jgi:hypothetical protein